MFGVVLNWEYFGILEHDPCIIKALLKYLTLANMSVLCIGALINLNINDKLTRYTLDFTQLDFFCYNLCKMGNTSMQFVIIII